MKIERLSENQIRCTLNKADLTEKQLKISELAYGTPKAKELFKDMMQQASVELGFEADDTPLMIEAIPVSPDCLILIVTKVEDPEELDTRFSRFSKTSEYDIDDDDEYMDDDDIDDDLDDNDESRDNNGTIARLEISGSGSVPQGVREALEGIFNTISGLAGTAGDFAAAANGSNTSSDDSTTGTAASTTGSTKESGSARLQASSITYPTISYTTECTNSFLLDIFFLKSGNSIIASICAPPPNAENSAYPLSLPMSYVKKYMSRLLVI